MPKSLSVDLCERIAEAIHEAEDSYVLIAERFNVSRASVLRVAKKRREGSSFEPAPRPGRPSLLEEKHRAFIQEMLGKNPYLSSYAMAELFNKKFRTNRVHRSTIFRAIRALGLTFKKNSILATKRPR